MAYRFNVKPSPAEPSQLDNFGNIRKDGSRQSLAGSPGNGFQTIDVSGTPLASPQTIGTTATIINVPLNATTITINPATAVNVSEVVSLSSYFTIPANTPTTIDVANQLNFYLFTGTGTSVVSFFFQIV
jgi:hypothetical protein